MTDERLERMVAALLRAGVLISASIVLAGGIWRLAQMGRAAPAYHQFRGVPPELRQAGLLLKSLAHPRPESLIQLGLLLLIATPVARVALALAAFALERDRTYVLATLIVLTILAYSMVLPFGGGG